MKRFFSGNPIQLIKAVKSYGGVDLSRIHVFALFFLKSLLFYPLGLLEFLIYGSTITKQIIDKPPVFILGHNRSGTTYLHKLLINDPRFGYCKNADMLFTLVKTPVNKLLRKGLQQVFNVLGVKSFAYRDTRLLLNDPQEEDMCMTALFMSASSYWGFVFPKYAHLNFAKFVYFNNESDKQLWQEQYGYFIRKIAFKNKRKQLLLKNPANTARVATLKKMFPDAKFLFIHRDPKRVFYSTKRIWEHAVDELGMQKIDKETIHENIFSHYEKMHESYEHDKHLLRDNQLCEISYLELETAPLKTLEKVYHQLHIDDFNSLKAKFTEQLEKEKNYRKFSYNYQNNLDNLVRKRLDKYFLKWNY